MSCVNQYFQTAYHVCSVILHSINQNTMGCLWLLQFVVYADRKKKKTIKFLKVTIQRILMNTLQIKLAN